MQFPEKLKLNGRTKKENTAIKSLNSLYARHKIKAEWTDGDDYPTFNTIKPDQSFNWGAYSIAFWVRFNDHCEYKSEYGIVKYRVKSIRNSFLKHLPTKDEFELIKHEPIENNYSHCELDGTLDLINKNIRREIRMNFKHKSKVICKPMEMSEGRNTINDKISMLKDLIISKLPFFK